MWKLSILTIGTSVLLLTTSVLGQCCTKNGVDDDGRALTENSLEELVRGSTEFALKLFDRVQSSSNGSEDNVVIAPISVWSALTATWHGARGRTKSQMDEVLEYGDGNQKRVNLLYHNLTNSLQHTASGQQDYTLNLVNKIYFDRKVPLRKCIVDYLRSETKRLPFSTNPEESRRRINQRVEGETNGLIKDLLPIGSVGVDTTMVLVNAVYFKGYWAMLFDRLYNGFIDFYVGPDRHLVVEAMHQPGKEYRIAESDELGCVALEVPLRGNDVRMVFFLPDLDTTVDNFVSKLSVNSVTDILHRLRSRTVELWIPKFNVEKSLDLKNHLKDLGLRDLFDEGKADLSGFTAVENYVKFVRHKTRVDVNEDGIEAAAATAVVMSNMTLYPIVVFDRPFVFMIQHQTTGAILFLGTIKNPGP